MLIAIAIAEEIQGLQRIGRFWKFWASGFALALARSFSESWVKENFEAQNLQNFFVKLCNPWISSAMAMAMRIYETLCVLVFLKISLLEILIVVGNVHLIAMASHWPSTTSPWPPMTPLWPPTDLSRTPHWPPMTPYDLPLTSHWLLMISQDFFNFGPFFFFFWKFHSQRCSLLLAMST